ncbi:hypothetical protein Axy23_016 [Achromobacter phage vB_AxyP_19-32_Axy23]|uniref:Uncharacterized protein n=1 Tax=Achromobacter phage vB_AxyP_19-32_Axy23 TaxID=2591047 RepID=A0A514CW51_9CAUD|nr:hypothetical protein Axy23_016 [Achromobacter phage vB_AxyP_19-32_Axy23]
MSKIKGMAIQLAQTKSKLEKAAQANTELRNLNGAQANVIETQRKTTLHLTDRLSMAKGIAQDLQTKLKTTEKAVMEVANENLALRDQISVLQQYAKGVDLDLAHKSRRLGTSLSANVIQLGVVLILLAALFGG